MGLSHEIPFILLTLLACCVVFNLDMGDFPFQPS